MRPDDLAARVLEALVGRTGLDPALVDDVYFGAANQSGEDNRNVARMAALLAGFPESVPGATVNRLCASGLEAVNIAARMIEAGHGEVFLAGGVESMSRAPFIVEKSPRPWPAVGNQTLWNTSIGWRMTNPKLPKQWTISNGESAEKIAREKAKEGRETRFLVAQAHTLVHKSSGAEERKCSKLSIVVLAVPGRRRVES